MHKVLLSVLLSAVLIAAGSSTAWALQSGGVAYGTLDSGRVSGIPFNTLDVDLEFTIMEIGGKKSHLSSDGHSKSRDRGNWWSCVPPCAY